MVPMGSIVSTWATGVGLMAGSIAVGGFLAHAQPALQRKGETEIRIATVVGGLAGLGGACLAILAQLLSAM